MSSGCGTAPEPRAVVGDVRGAVLVSGEPAARAELEWRHANGTGRAVADEAGTFELRGLPPGEVELVAFPEGRPSPLARARESVRVDAGEVREVVLRVNWRDLSGPPFDLGLRLVLADGTPVEGASVSTSGAEVDATGETAADGSLHLRGHGAHGRLRVHASWRGLFHRWEVSLEPGVRELTFPDVRELILQAFDSGATRIRNPDVYWRRAGTQAFQHIPPALIGGLEPPNRLVTDAPAVDLWVRAHGYIPKPVAGVRTGTLADPRTLEVELERGESLHAVGDPRGDDPLPGTKILALTRSEFDERLPLHAEEFLAPSLRFPLRSVTERLVYRDGDFRSIDGLPPGEYWFVTHPDTLRVEPASVVVPTPDGRPVALRCFYADQGHPDYWGERR